MRVLASTFLTTALVSIASIASAQPAETAPAAAPAPQNADWNNVCHINGQLVPCGESNTYLKPIKKTVIATNPIGLIVGDYTLAVSHAVSDHIAIRGEATYVHIVGDNNGDSMTELDLGAPIYLRRTFQGPFVEPGVALRSVSNDAACYDAYGNTTSCGGSTDQTVGPQVLVGWQWTWDSGFDVAIAAGMGRNLASNTSSDSQLFPNGYFKIGYAF